MAALYKFKADVKPSLYIILFFFIQCIICYSITDYSLLIPLTLLMIPILGVTAASFNHHHQHHNIFKLSALNRLFELILSLQTGLSSYAWVLHHNLGHHPHYQHQYADSTDTTAQQSSPFIDESRWTFKNGKTMNIWQYSLLGFCMAYCRVHKVGLKYKSVYKKYLICRAIYYSVIITGIYIIGMPFVIVFIIPSLIILLFTITATYQHHAGLRSDDHYASSYNNVNKIYNLITCNLGYHTAHHLRPGLHWSLLPAFHESIQHKMPSALIHDTPPRTVRLFQKLRLGRALNSTKIQWFH